MNPDCSPIWRAVFFSKKLRTKRSLLEKKNDIFKKFKLFQHVNIKNKILEIHSVWYLQITFDTNFMENQMKGGKYGETKNCCNSGTRTYCAPII